MLPAAQQILESSQLPAAFQCLPHPPDRLFLRGSLGCAPYVAVVGTRHPSSEAEQFAVRLAQDLAEQGVTIVSGGAIGIDAAAHRGALRAGGCTVVVAPCGFEAPFPAQHRPLFEEIVVRRGGYLSAYEQEVVARRHHFFLRNSLLAALCDALVMVEAPLRSGARNAVSWARRLGKPCFAVPSAPWNPRGTAFVPELKLGARPLTGPKELMRCLRDGGRHALALKPPAPLLRRSKTASPAAGSGTSASGAGDRPVHGAESIERHLASGPSTLDELVAVTGLPIAELQHALLLLQLQGTVRRDADGRLTSGPE